MPRKSILTQLSLVGTILLGLLIGLYLVIGRRFSKPDPSGSVIQHKVNTPPADVLKYWTADRMRNAKPADMPNITLPEQGKKHPPHPRHTSDPEHS